MKKFIALVLIVVIAIAAVAVLKWDSLFHTTTDLSSKSVAELLRLQSEVKAELERKSTGNGLSSWYEYGMGRYLPNPNDVIGRKVAGFYDLGSSDEEYCSDRFKAKNADEFKLYCEACIGWGFTDVKNYGATRFTSCDSEGREVDLTYFKDPGEVSVRISLKDD